MTARMASVRGWPLSIAISSSDIAAISYPEQKALSPLPLITTHLISVVFPSLRNSSVKSLRISGVREFLFSGRLRVRVQIEPSVSMRISLFSAMEKLYITEICCLNST